MNCKPISFHLRENPAGNLSFLEGEHDLPFEIKRAYYIYDVPADGRRGFHAHKELQQCLICIHGSCKILVDDGKEQRVYELNNPNEGLYIGPVTWREMFDFSDGAVLLALVSQYYTEEDYIRDYAQFKEYVNGGSDK
ncbi:MAG: FdtA/QdtA family cupin domain-containing protein [Eubacteriales bacterium]|nr:FdtA/QdtA family cupin domain-containing protein [Eubacteriales bacterium]